MASSSVGGKIFRMAETATGPLVLNPPLTALSEEERMFQATAREFAEKEVGPHVEEMDREGAFKHELIEKFFAQGFMGIEIPEAYGGNNPAQRDGHPRATHPAQRDGPTRRAQRAVDVGSRRAGFGPPSA